MSYLFANFFFRKRGRNVWNPGEIVPAMIPEQQFLSSAATNLPPLRTPHPATL